jgi:hypothetical protein
LSKKFIIIKMLPVRLDRPAGKIFSLPTRLAGKRQGKCQAVRPAAQNSLRLCR